MTAQDRMTAALDIDFFDCWTGEAQSDGSVISTFDRGRLATKMLAADPTLARDMEDGRALRELREALPSFMDDEGMERRADMTVQGPLLTHPDTAWDVSVSLWDEVAHATGPTIAEAADACRAALEERK